MDFLINQLDADTVRMVALAYWLVLAFVLGAAFGSFINVIVARLPFEKSLVWPGSRCGVCLQPVRWYDNLPLVSYLVLRGRCRNCGASFSPRYFFIELLTGLGFAGLFYVEVALNVHRWPNPGRPWAVQEGLYPWQCGRATATTHCCSRSSWSRRRATSAAARSPFR